MTETWKDEYEDDSSEPPRYTEIQIGSYSVEGVLGLDEPEAVGRARYLLAPVRQSMEAAGFYAYTNFNQQQQLAIASDDEAGRFDIFIDGEDLVVSLWASSPGMFVEEENQWRRRAMERLARMQITAISKGQLAPHQEALWDDDDKGVAVRLTFHLPLAQSRNVGQFVRDRIPELEEVLGFVENEVAV